MELYDNDFCCMELYDEQFLCMEVNPVETIFRKLLGMLIMQYEKQINN